MVISLNDKHFALPLPGLVYEIHLPVVILLLSVEGTS